MSMVGLRIAEVRSGVGRYVPSGHRTKGITMFHPLYEWGASEINSKPTTFSTIQRKRKVCVLEVPYKQAVRKHTLGVYCFKSIGIYHAKQPTRDQTELQYLQRPRLQI